MGIGVGISVNNGCVGSDHGGKAAEVRRLSEAEGMDIDGGGLGLRVHSGDALDLGAQRSAFVSSDDDVIRIVQLVGIGRRTRGQDRR